MKYSAAQPSPFLSNQTGDLELGGLDKKRFVFLRVISRFSDTFAKTYRVMQHFIRKKPSCFVTMMMWEYFHLMCKYSYLIVHMW